MFVALTVGALAFTVVNCQGGLPVAPGQIPVRDCGLDQIVASHSKEGKVDRTRPLCPYPQIATYKGSGSIEEAASFVCK